MKVAVIVPCLNEEATVGKVVAECLQYLPSATVYVLDNGSTDKTAECARRAGAKVTYSPLRGKGHVLRHALRLIDADFYVMIDGDGTYPMDQAQKLLSIAKDYNYEMVMGSRLELGKAEAFRPMHYLGNRIFTRAVRVLFNYPIHDLLTGFRIFSRRFIDEVQFVSSGFEIETELTIRAIAQNLAFCEVAVPYAERPAGSRSKLRTFRDGWIILRTIVRLFRDFRPLRFFAGTAGLCLAASLYVPPQLVTPFSMVAALFLVLGFYLESQLDLERFKLRRSNQTQNGDSQDRSGKKSA